jgi:hypothetical protein
MDSYQSFRASSSLGEEEKKCDRNERVDVDPTATVSPAAFDDILTTVRKEEWYTVSQP